MAITPDVIHPGYDKLKKRWGVMRDVIEGHDAVQKRGETYLPKLSDQTPSEYESYKGRAVFFNATGRTVDSLTGMIFRKPPQTNGLDKGRMGEVAADITMTGIPLAQFAENLVQELLGPTRAGVLVDFPTVQRQEGAPITLDVAQREGLRAYAVMYRAEQIINWRTMRVGGKTVLSLVVLRECDEQVSATNPFAMEQVEQFRVLKLENGLYVQEIWRQQKGAGKSKTGLVLEETLMPLRDGKRLNEIPFEFFGAKGNQAEPDSPILYDMAVVNLAHYRNTADMEHGLHFTGLPTAYIAGVDTKDEYRIGSGVAWTFSNAQAKAEFLEFTGQGLGPLRTGIQDKEAQMAALGARILAPEKSGVEAVETVTMKRQGETSVLGSLANATSRGLTRVLRLIAAWEKEPEDCSITLNTDYAVSRMSAQEIQALTAAVSTGNISWQSYYEALVRGEVVSGERTAEDERNLIAEGQPGGGVSDDGE